MNSRTLRAGGLLAAAASVLLLAACSGGAKAPDVAGAWGDPDERGKPSLEFTPADDGAAGEVGGNDGCNVLGASYKIADDVIEFGVVRSTMMFCEGVDTWLSQAHTATVDGDTLHVKGEDGSEIGTLTRASK